jgi:hypothetical protein
MPTNKLWLEHTERAAWDSVQTLREMLRAAEKRLKALAPPIEGWQALLDALDSANEEHRVGETYAEIVRGLVTRLRTAEARVRALENNPPPLFRRRP